MTLNSSRGREVVFACGSVINSLCSNLMIAKYISIKTQKLLVKPKPGIAAIILYRDVKLVAFIS